MCSCDYKGLSGNLALKLFITELCYFPMTSDLLMTSDFSMINLKALSGCEGDLVATSVTPLIARVDSADLAG